MPYLRPRCLALSPTALQISKGAIIEEAKADSHGHHDSLIAIDRLTINEILILKRRIAHYDIEGSKDLLGREIDHIHNRADNVLRWLPHY